IVVIDILSFEGKSERRHGGDEIALVKKIRASIRIDHGINEIGRELGLLRKIIFNTTVLFKLYWISKRYTRCAGAETARVDTEQQLTRLVIIIIFMIELAA